MIDGLKRYPAYKDSGVPWLGEVPGHWEVASLRHLVRVRSGDAPPGDKDVEGLYPVFGANGVIGRASRFNSAARRVVVGRVGAAGAVNVTPPEAWITDNVLIVDPSSKRIIAEFLPRLLGSVDLASLTSQSAQPLITGGHIKARKAAVPPLPEQSAIVRFLDHADRRIRRYIRTKKKLIGLLNEQKQAIIHQAVTRGLDPNVRLKPSGVEWLGDVPEHWEVVRFGRIIELATGFPFKSEGFTQAENDVRLLRGVNISPGHLRWNDVVRWPAAYRASFDEYELRQGDIVLGMDRPIIQGGVRVSSISETDVPSLLLQRVARIRPHAAVRAEFALLLLAGKGFSDYLTPIFTGISVPHLSPEQIKSFRMALPGVDEQMEIVEQVTETTWTVRLALDVAEREISLLREYRTRLIADVVTGKLDVREAAAKLPDEPEEPEVPEEGDALMEAGGEGGDIDLEPIAEEEEANA